MIYWHNRLIKSYQRLGIMNQNSDIGECVCLSVVTHIWLFIV